MSEKAKLGAILVAAGLIDELQLESALGKQARWGNRLGEALVARVEAQVGEEPEHGGHEHDGDPVPAKSGELPLRCGRPSDPPLGSVETLACGSSIWVSMVCVESGSSPPDRGRVAC